MLGQVLLTIRRKWSFRLSWAAEAAVVFGGLYLLVGFYNTMGQHDLKSRTISDSRYSTFSRKLNVFRFTMSAMTTKIPKTAMTESRRNNNNNNEHKLDDVSTAQALRARLPGDTTIETDYHHNKSIVCHTINCGRLGNTFFEYASVLGIAMATGKIPFITNMEVLQAVLKNPPPLFHAFQRNSKLRDKMNARCAKARKVNDGEGGTYHEHLKALKPGQDYHVNRCLQSFKYFSGFFDEVREAVVFSDEIVRNATRVMEDLRSRFPNSTFVGIHVRRGDVANNSMFLKRGWVLATPEYFRRAMAYFRDWLGGRVMFLVVSQDADWCSANVASSRKDVVLLQSSSAEVDMQILSMMDHLVQSIGSYSWWSAFKIPGKPKIVYFKDWAKNNSILDRWFTTSDYMLPEWLPM